MQVAIWQRIVGIHQSAHVRALANRIDKVSFCAEVELTPDRQAMGWADADLGAATLRYAKTETDVAEIIRGLPKETIHIIGGLRGHKIGHLALKLLSQQKLRVGLLAEGADPTGVKGLVRRAVYRVRAPRINQQIDFLLAIGTNGISWYKSSGYPENKLFPYAYFTEQPQEPSPRFDGQGPFRIIYIGQCIYRKNVDLLLKALSTIVDRDWHLTIIGEGDRRPQLEQAARRLPEPSRVSFVPFTPTSEAMRYLSSSDLLVLPSRFDGWGAVVNEALMHGVPVACSSSCGSRDLVCESWRGDIFKSNDTEALRQILSRRMVSGHPSPADRKRLALWSSCISGESAATYLMSILAHVYEKGPRPAPPWTI